MTAEERNDIAEGNVWPEGEEPAPAPWCDHCQVDTHGFADCPHNPDRIAFKRYRPRDWPRSSRGMDPGLFC